MFFNGLPIAFSCFTFLNARRWKKNKCHKNSSELNSAFTRQRSQNEQIVHVWLGKYCVWKNWSHARTHTSVWMDTVASNLSLKSVKMSHLSTHLFKQCCVAMGDFDGCWQSFKCPNMYMHYTAICNFISFFDAEKNGLIGDGSNGKSHKMYTLLSRFFCKNLFSLFPAIFVNLINSIVVGKCMLKKYISH